MSLYNLMNGVNPATFILLPMLEKHYSEYPRFRDCFVGKLSNSNDNDQFGIPRKQLDESDCLSIYTRVGGGNREEYKEAIEELRNMETYVEDYDDDFDSTFATFVFNIPDKWKEDFAKLKRNKRPSEEYIDLVVSIYPKIGTQLRQMFEGIQE